MGYGADTISVNFYMTAEHVQAAARQHMEHRNQVEEAILNNHQNLRAYVRDMFRDAGWVVEFGRSSGDVVYVSHHDNLWSDGTKRLFKLLAPFVQPGSTIEMSGEDDTRWRYLFSNGTFVEEYAIGPFYNLFDLVKKLMDHYGSETTLNEVFLAEELKAMLGGTPA